MDDFMERIEDINRRCIDKNIVTCTNFLTPAEQVSIKSRKYKNVLLNGGSTLCERRRAFFLPEYIDEKNFDIKEYITALKISFSFTPLTHRDFLGSLMGLNIKRECIGDIYVFDKCTYLYINKDISPYIMMNLEKVGNTGVTVKEIILGDVCIPEPKIETIKFTVNSLRLDSVISGTFKISRENAIKKIKEGLVMLNYVICENPSKTLNVEDIISMRGYGKAKLASLGNLSKKNRLFINMEKLC